MDSRDPVSLEQSADPPMPNLELLQFYKYSKLVPELRSHILSYLNFPELFNYSQCTKFCNSEIQKFNTKPPKSLELHQEENGGIRVKVVYKVKYYREHYGPMNKSYYVEKKFQAGEDIKKYLLRIYKYVKQDEKTEDISIDMSFWPKEVLEIPHIQNIPSWKITLSKLMFEDFVNFVESTHSLKSLALEDCETINDRVTVPTQFFKLQSIRNLSGSFCINTKFEMDEVDFLEIHPKYFQLSSWVDFQRIRAKLIRCNRDRRIGFCELSIDLPDEHPQHFSLLELFPYQPFRTIYDLRKDRFRIGRTYGYIENYSKTLRLMLGAYPSIDCDSTGDEYSDEE